MQCPQCSFKMGINDRICPRCCFFAETGASVEVQPPRASESRPFMVVPRVRMGGRNKRGSEADIRRFTYVFIGIIPGLGHLLGGHIKRALAYSAAWCAIIAAAFYLHDAYGQVILAIGGLVHAYSLYDLLPRASDQTPASEHRRLGITIVATLFLIYWPVSEYLGWVEPLTIRTNRNNVIIEHLMFLVFMGFLAVLLYGFVFGLIWIIGGILPGRKQR